MPGPLYLTRAGVQTIAGGATLPNLYAPNGHTCMPVFHFPFSVALPMIKQNGAFDEVVLRRERSTVAL